ncbi:MAG: hypothetical protein HXS46_20670 [Theionarchaea archaeon]|nr:MAG: hypothetical protein AYK18_08895 [Theionarchaea archaeon DG-70]MBU7013102.1 hypothetical protein [Theionarchaea archaeon]
MKRFIYTDNSIYNMRDNNSEVGKNDLSMNYEGNNETSETEGEERKAKQPGNFWIVAYIVYVALWFIALVNILIGLWPLQAASGSQSASVRNVQVLWGLLSGNITEEMQFVLIVAIMGALGGLVYSMTLFAHYIGREDFKTRYWCWYVLRPLIGAILAVILYLAFRGAFFTFSTGTQNLNPSCIAALGGVVGIFSQEAMEKLRELARNLFNVEESEKLRELAGSLLEEKVGKEDESGSGESSNGK